MLSHVWQTWSISCARACLLREIRRSFHAPTNCRCRSGHHNPKPYAATRWARFVKEVLLRTDVRSGSRPRSPASWEPLSAPFARRNTKSSTVCERSWKEAGSREQGALICDRSGVATKFAISQIGGHWVATRLGGRIEQGAGSGETERPAAAAAGVEPKTGCQRASE